uniref:Uncharacterized protein n=1 Tax=Panagrolaimus sp. PS1159 TaxID=55785 RepID=A0AC35GDG4_9BILA
MDSYIHFLTSEKNYKQKIGIIERNFHKIEERLNSLVGTLSKLALTVPKKEGRRELVIRMQQQSQNSLKSLKKVKRFCISCEQCLHRLQDFYFPTWRLEGSLPTAWPRELDDYETRLLEHSFKWFGTKSSDFDIKLKTAFYFEPQNQSIPYQLKRYDVEKLFFLDFDRRTFLWDLRSCVGFFDRRLAKDYREDAVRIFKDLNIFINEAPEGTRFFVVPMVKCEKKFKNFKLAAVKGELDESEQKEVPSEGNKEIAAGPDGDMEFASKGQIESAYWSELELSVLCLIEIQPSGSVVFEDLQNPTFFEEKLGTQVKKLKSLGIDLKIDKLQASLNVAHESNGSGGGIETEASNLTDDFGVDGKKAKAKKIEEILANEISRDRWRRHPPFSGTRRLSLRDPLELALTFSKSPIFVDTIDLCNTVNSLDLSNMKITKLDGIEQMLNLSCISLANNKLTSIKKLKHLKNLQFLDLRNNNISHFDEPPEMLTEINLSDNQFIGLMFCGRLQVSLKKRV